MNVIYLETSALLTWLFNETGAMEVIETVNAADLVVTSLLIRIETARACNRALREKLVNSSQHTMMLESFESHRKAWFHMNMDEAVILRASQNFPIEPVRSFDALHLATALEYRKLYLHCRVLSLDKRIRENAAALGM